MSKDCPFSAYPAVCLSVLLGARGRKHHAKTDQLEINGTEVCNALLYRKGCMLGMRLSSSCVFCTGFQYFLVDLMILV